MAPILLLLALPSAAASLRAQVLAAELKREAPYLARPDGMQAALRPPADDNVKGVAVVVDPLCDYLGVALIEELLERGVAVATVLSDYMASGLAAANGVEPPLALLAPRTDGEAWLSGAAPPLACLSESDAGIATAEQLSNLLGCAFRNAVSPSRRHKWLLHETLREHNLPHCRQALCETEGELVAFYRAERNAIIVKPCRGVGSEDVYKCCDEATCANAFSMLKATTRYAGGPNDVILAQQFLEGPEYAIDSVSRNGEHKVTALWRYDKIGFVYQCTRLVPVDGATRPIIEALIEALDAAGHANGPAHSELIISDGVPTLVEINARFHNANVRPLVDRCIEGPNAIALAAAACVPDSEEWDAVDAVPALVEDGLLFHISCLQSGVLSGIDADALSTLENLPTLVEMEIYESFREGEEVSATTDIKTDVGWVLLAGTADDVERDYAACLEAQARLLKYR